MTFEKILKEPPQDLAYHPAWWLNNAHAQTIWPTLFRIPDPMEEKWERVELPDGDFIDLVWDKETADEEQCPIVVLFHGLGGGIKSPYFTGLMRALSRKNLRPVLMHFRGCSGVPNRLPKAYHSGGTQDMREVVDVLMKKHPNVPFAAVGISLGGNALLKWLGETSASNPLRCAAAVSVPFVLEAVADRLMRGVSRLYQWKILSELKKGMKEKFKRIRCPFDIAILDTTNNFWEFDDKITAPLHGFKDVYEYYRQSGCRQYLRTITVPTLIIHSKDDPFMTSDVIPQPSEMSPAIELDLTDKGGHVGFIEGEFPGFPTYWLEKRLAEYIPKQLQNYKL